VIDDESARDEPHRAARDAEVQPEGDDADTLGMCAGQLREEGFVRAAAERPGEEEELEDDEEIDARRDCGARRRREEEKGEERPERRRAEDERKPPAEAGAGPVAPVADQRIVERLDEPRSEEERADDRDRQQLRYVGVRRRRVVVQKPETTTLREGLAAQARGGVERPGPDRKASGRRRGA
jgi:hypothetical protein